jgi:uncharacterized YccA/Bax inhibitor family protein
MLVLSLPVIDLARKTSPGFKMRSGNPALNENTFSDLSVYHADGDSSFRMQSADIAAAPASTMTIRGTAQKTMILLLIAAASGSITWGKVLNGGQIGLGQAIPWILAGAAVGLITALIIGFRPKTAPTLAPVYAAAEGLFLGAFSAVFEARYPGIVTLAVGLTFGTLAGLLLAYQSGLIRATENFKLGIAAATMGICVMYLISFIGRWFGFEIPYIHGSGPIGIGVSAFVVVIAALNLVLDFDFIEDASERGAPKYLEWYGAFALLVTLIWLYMEILRLLAKLNDRK